MGRHRLLRWSAHEDRPPRNPPLRCRVAQLPLRQGHNRRRRGGLERVRRGLRLPGNHGDDRALGADPNRQGSRQPRADLLRAVLPAATGRRRGDRASLRRDRKRPARCQGQDLGSALLRALWGQGARPYPAVLVALCHMAHQSPGVLPAGDPRPRWRPRDRRGGQAAGLHRLEDQYLRVRGRDRAGVATGLRHALRAGPQHGALHAAATARPPRCLAGRCRAGHGHPARPELQLRHRGLSQSAARVERLRPVLGGNRHAQSARAATHPRAKPLPHQLVRNANGPAQLPALLPARSR